MLATASCVLSTYRKVVPAILGGFDPKATLLKGLQSALVHEPAKPSFAATDPVAQR
jgi:hypothetical protein